MSNLNKTITIRGFIAVLGLSILVSCESATTKQYTLPANIQTRLTAAFGDNTGDFTPDPGPKGEIARLIVSRLKVGYEKFDISLIESILAPDFERRFLVNSTGLRVENRDTFLKERKGWTKLNKSTREIYYSIQEIEIGVEKNTAFVTALTTYKSKFFNPRFIEILIFQKKGPNWLLKRQFLSLLHPKDARQFGVQIFIVDEYLGRDFSERFQKTVNQKGADAFIDQSVKNGYSFHPRDKDLTYLVVFREPPSIGTKIRVDTNYYYSGYEDLFDLTYEMNKEIPYLILSPGGHIDLNGTFRIKVSVDGVLVTERSFSIY